MEHILVSFSTKKSGIKNLVKRLNEKGIPTKGYGDFRYYNLSGLITNPHKVKALKKLDGRNEKVKNYLLRCPKTDQWLNSFYSIAEKTRVFCLCCLGGKHRSVAMIELLAARMIERGYDPPKIIHLELEE